MPVAPAAEPQLKTEPAAAAPVGPRGRDRRRSVPQPVRPLTDIESVLVRDLFDRGIHELSYAFESLMAIEAKVVQQEFNPQFAQIAAPSDMTLVIHLDMRIGTQLGDATLCLPYP